MSPRPGLCTGFGATMQGLSSAPCHQLTARHQKKPFPFLSFLALVPPQSRRRFFWRQPRCSQKHRLNGGPWDTAEACDSPGSCGWHPGPAAPHTAGWRCPSPPPLSHLSCPFQPLGSQETGLLSQTPVCLLALCQACPPAILEVTSPLKSITATPFRDRSSAVRVAF